MRHIIEPLKWDGQSLQLIDQRKLPEEEVFVKVTNISECFDAIRDMVVRGAPLIGFSGIWGMVLYAQNNPNSTFNQFVEKAHYLSTARPTAVNLKYELDRAIQLAKEHFNEKTGVKNLRDRLITFANEQMDLLERNNRRMAEIAQAELRKRYGDRSYTVMTLCNTGYLACGPLGTALGVVSHLHEQKKIDHVYASETRPYMQGARLTAYELFKQNIPHEVFVEGASSYILKNKKVDAVFIGADRIVSNGDTANKVGSSSLSIIARNYEVPFFVVAPTSSFDLSLKSGDEIEIEMRSADEIHYLKEHRITPIGSGAINPSFDVTDHNFITGIICENGYIDPSQKGSVSRLVKGNND